MDRGVGVENKCVLLADPRQFSMGMVRSILEMAGYVVLEAANLDEAIRRPGKDAQWISFLRRKIFLPTAVQNCSRFMRQAIELEEDSSLGNR